MRSRARLAALLLVVACAALGGRASAATLSGQVANTSGTGLQSMEVTLWAEDVAQKRWEIVATTTTASDGSWQFAGVAAGAYRLHARMAAGISGNYADRWYDVAEPNADGYVAEYADVLEVGDADSLTGLDFTLPVVGGLDGQVVDEAGTPLTAMQVRVERSSEPRVHHNDWTQGRCCADAHWGRYYIRGLPPAGDYRVLAHDPTGVRGTRVAAGPYPVSPSSNGNVPNIVLPALSADPYEPNGSLDEAGADSVDDVSLHADPPVAWESSGAWVGPRGSDVDYHCFDVVSGDRLLVTAASTIDPGGLGRESPWVDPYLWLVDGVTGEVLYEDDDSGPGGRDAFVDTGEIGAAGRLCAVVSTFGDVDHTGAGQQSAGAYALEVAMGNRRPFLNVTPTVDDVPLDELLVDEGQVLVLDLRFGDPDHDPLDVSLEHLDTNGDALDLPTLVLGANAGTYTWTISETAAAGSPYTMAVVATDGELDAEVDLVVEVAGVNRAPTTPELRLPEEASTVREAQATLVVGNSTDADGDPLQYDFEVYFDGLQSEPDDAERVVEGDNGETSWTTGDIPDNTVVTWRARAFDGGEDNAYSPWSDPQTFLVDAFNSPPTAPVLTKPDNGEELTVRWPTLSVRNSSDPEGDAILLTFEVAADPQFETLVANSEPVRQSALGSTTNWPIDVPLAWGGTYYARASAADDLGATSDYSNVNVFRIKPNDVAGAPSLGEPFAGQCLGYNFGQEPPSEVVVANVEDPDGEPVTLELEIFDYDADPETAEPLVAVSVPQDDGAAFTVIPLDVEALANPGHYRLRVRGFDGTDATEWAECDFFVAEPPRPASPLVILAPAEGTIFPRDTQEVLVEVQNAYDPELSPGETLEVAYCLSADPNYAGCDADPAAWPAVMQSSPDPEATTTFPLEGFDKGQNWWLRACARRASGQCGLMDTTQFSIQQPEKVVTPGCACLAAGADAPSGLPIAGAVLTLVALARRRSRSAHRR